jgi:elongation factor Ts
MHIAASSPLSLDETGISQSFLENEKNIMKDQLLNEGKKIEMIDKIILGKLSKIIKDNTLLGQKWVMNPELSVNMAIKNFEDENKASFVIKQFVRYKVGEGIENKKSDFAEEVKNLTK